MNFTRPAQSINANMRLSSFPLVLAIVCSLALLSPRAAEKTAAPSGPQTDGDFRKFILDSDSELDGKLADTLKDPMELAIAPDGRVFYAERAGKVKMWNPDTKETVVIANIQVFDGLEEGMLGITLDPKFSENGWVYLNHSLPETTNDSQGKAGIIRVSRYTLKGDALDLASEKTIIDMPV